MKQAIDTDQAPRAIGPYSQAVSVPCSELVFLSGQIALRPDGSDVLSGDAIEQAQQVMSNLAAVLEQAGLSFHRVVKATIFLTDLDDFAMVNEVYASYFEEPYPARACVQVAALPKGAKVEIDLIAARS